MTIANWCVLIAAFLPVVFAGLAKGSMAGKRRSEGGYDNNDPRGWFDKQAGWRKRMNSVQQNSFEALPFFIGAIALAQLAHGPQDRIDLLAMIYIGLRVAYAAIYAADLATLRTLVWTAAAGVNVGILLASGAGAAA